jgi:8-oxo-dGTP diphosphatase
MPREPLRVVAAALVRRGTEGQLQVLIAQRPPGKWQAGCWEFPGGKIDAGEAAEAAIIRELAEEIGIKALRLSPVQTFHHDYPDRSVEIGLWLVPEFSGQPRGLDGQALRWVAPEALAGSDLLEADVPMIGPLLAALSGLH